MQRVYFFSLYFVINALISSYFIRESKAFFIENIIHKTKASIILPCSVFHILKSIIIKTKKQHETSHSRYSSRTTDVSYTKTRFYNKKRFSYRILRSFIFSFVKMYSKNILLLSIFICVFLLSKVEGSIVFWSSSLSKPNVDIEFFGKISLYHISVGPKY